MKKKISRIIAAVMLIVAVVFIVFAFNHPELSFPWNNTVSYIIYASYIIVTIILLIAPFSEKNS